MIQSPVFREGVRGQALYFDENDRGFLGKDVGWYDRQDPFSIDFWFYVGDDLRERARAESPGRAELRPHRLPVHDRTRQALGVARALAAGEHDRLQTIDALPVHAWTHIALTYDGSSRAAGLRLYLERQAAATEVKHDHLTRSILPWTSGDVFDPFLGLAFGTRFREKAPSAAPSTSCACSSAILLRRSRVPARRDAAARQPSELEPQLAQLLAATDAKVVAARAALTAARARENELATAVPQVLVMGDAPEPIPTSC